ncbi:hypothetical protein Mpsy_1416 [Methanolobus psychrophilus R15]|nr:hypothetical protein Mpsy_1416 [Methanolobus psychrophilus R15]
MAELAIIVDYKDLQCSHVFDLFYDNIMRIFKDDRIILLLL